MKTKPRARGPSGLDWTAFGTLAAVLLAWEALSRVLEVRPDVLPAPSRIAWELWREPRLREHSAVTCSEVLNGFLLAVFLGMAIAVVVGCSPRVYRAGARIISFLQAAPLLIVVPLLVVWLGFGSPAKVLIVIILCIPPIAAGMISGLRSVPQEMNDFLQTTNSGRLRSFWIVRLPMSLPGLFRGMKTAASLAVVGAAAGEFVGANRGFGYLAIEGMAGMNTPLVFAGLAGLASIAIGLRAAVALLQFAFAPVAMHEKKN